MKRNSTITKKKFLLGFLVITLFLALIRVIVPSVAETRVILRNNNVKHKLVVATKSTDSVKIKYQSAPREVALSYFFNSDGSPKKNRILGVRDYDESFPDSQPQQLSAALKFGVKPVADRVDAERRKSELVYIGSNPYYNMNSIIVFLILFLVQPFCFKISRETLWIAFRQKAFLLINFLSQVFSEQKKM